MQCVQVRDAATQRSQTYHFHVKKLQRVVLPSGTLASIAKVSDTQPLQAVQQTTLVSSSCLHTAALYTHPLSMSYICGEPGYLSLGTSCEQQRHGRQH